MNQQKENKHKLSADTARFGIQGHHGLNFIPLLFCPKQDTAQNPAMVFLNSSRQISVSYKTKKKNLL